MSTILFGFSRNKIPNWFCFAIGIFFTGVGSLVLSFVKALVVSSFSTVKPNTQLFYKKKTVVSFLKTIKS